MERRLEGRTALVTGGGRGIGRAIAIELAAQGANVAVNYRRDRNAASETMSAIAAHGVHTDVFEADVSDDAQATRLVDSVQRRFGTLGILVCNAGIVLTNLAALQSREDWCRILDLNLLGTVACIRAAIPAMLAARRGSIVCVSSLAAARGSSGLSSYAASKGAVNALVRSLAVELAGKGIRVNAVAPGLIETELLADLPQRAGRTPGEHIPMARLGRAEEVARAVRFLASDDASYITGQILAVDGGLGV
ncbi:MAG TPA: SDR family NAD(P)-dependent oxidoreductase [Thermoanaerobaculia bacterium]|nr:SDR family NAD(P)-dependent oxidoreductase [Thermoanaerobaculia bacterium]